MRLDPRLLNLYGVTQSLMEHAYWLYPDMEGMAGSVVVKWVNQKLIPKQTHQQ
jgi:hypothetical protein